MVTGALCVTVMCFLPPKGAHSELDPEEMEQHQQHAKGGQRGLNPPVTWSGVHLALEQESCGLSHPFLTYMV